MIKLSCITLLAFFNISHFAIADDQSHCLNAEATHDRSVNCASVAETYFNKKMTEYSNASAALWERLFSLAKRPARMSKQVAEAIAESISRIRLELAELSFSTYNELEPMAATDEKRLRLMKVVLTDNIYMFTEEKFATPVGGVNSSRNGNDQSAPIKRPEELDQYFLDVELDPRAVMPGE